MLSAMLWHLALSLLLSMAPNMVHMLYHWPQHDGTGKSHVYSHGRKWPWLYMCALLPAVLGITSFGD